MPIISIPVGLRGKRIRGAIMLRCMPRPRPMADRTPCSGRTGSSPVPNGPSAACYGLWAYRNRVRCVNVDATPSLFSVEAISTIPICWIGFFDPWSDAASSDSFDSAYGKGTALAGGKRAAMERGNRHLQAAPGMTTVFQELPQPLRYCRYIRTEQSRTTDARSPAGDLR